MAKIFYWTVDQFDNDGTLVVTAGTIYGVHPDGNITVPGDVASIDVLEMPDKINWPLLPDGNSGTEQTSHVNLITLQVEVDLNRVPPTARQKIIARLRADPILKAQVIDSFEARGITDKQVMLAALEAKFADTI